MRAGSHRVLVVDDNPAIHADFRKVLAPVDAASPELDALAADLFGEEAPEDDHPLDVELGSASQGQQALEMIRAARAEGRPYAVAFVDVRMPPGWDGIETTERLWQVDPHLQVVICTAYSDYSWKEMLSRLGTTDRLLLLKKPFDSIEVAQLVLALTRKWTVEEEGRRHVTELERLVRERTDELVAAHDQLRMSQKLEAIGRLGVGLAHEINNPAQFVTHNLEYLVEAAGTIARAVSAHDASATTELASVLGEIPIAASQGLMGIQRITRVVAAMLEFSKAGSEEKAPADLNRAVESTLTITEDRWRPVAELRVELGSLPWVPCRIGAIKQVILSVVDNAVQAMAGRRPPGVLTVRTRAEDGFAILEIGDTGRGIPEAIRDRVFDPFYTTREVGEGTGQGLATARAIVVEQHGGTIRFTSEVGVGTTFVVRLPLAVAPAAAA